MAKRTRSEADDAAMATTPPAAPKGGRTRARGAAKGGGQAPGDVQTTADDPTVASAPTMINTQAARPSPADTHPPEDTITADPRVIEANHYDESGGPTESEIRRRAYELYVARGGQHGMDADDWYRAEQELKRRRRR